MRLLIILLAGWGAGTVTGLVGASAVVIVTPVLIIFLGYNPYTAIGISLATDVFASSMSAITYGKHDNIDMKNGILIAVFAVAAAVLGSWLSGDMDSNILGGFSGIIILMIGISFMRKPINEQMDELKEKFNLTFLKKNKHIISIIAGTLTGTITGIFGAGGGIAFLIILTFVLDYKIHVAVGTSVLIMIFAAFSGSLSHFIIEASFPYIEVIVSGLGGIVGAYMAANYANLISEKKLSRAIGIVFIILGGIATIQQFLK